VLEGWTLRVGNVRLETRDVAQKKSGVLRVALWTLQRQVLPGG